MNEQPTVAVLEDWRCTRQKQELAYSCVIWILQGTTEEKMLDNQEDAGEQAQRNNVHFFADGGGATHAAADENTKSCNTNVAQ